MKRPSYLRGLVEESEHVARGTKVLKIRLEEELEASPGQFFMVWVPRIGEIPLSVADLEKDELTFVIAKVGRVTSYISEEVKRGSEIFLRGPYGRAFSKPSGRALMVAGGRGLTPLYFLSKEIRRKKGEVDVLLGFRSREDVFFTREFEELCEVEVATEDGSLGFKGTVLELARGKLNEGKYEIVYTCGKEAMMFSLLGEVRRRGLRFEASLERIMRCAIGICGSCVLDPLGLRVCKDGPVFNGETLSKLTDFGRYWRLASGEKTRIDRPSD